MEDNLNTTITLDDLNNKQIKKLLVPIAYLVVLGVIGIPGNLTVFIIYRRKYTSCVYRTIIRSLALVDFVFCVTAIPFNIGRVINYYTFTELWLCKAFTTIIIFFINYSSHLLLLLSIHRFRQACMPLKSQITDKNVFCWILVCCIVSIIYTSPHPFLQPLSEVELANNLTGHICPVSWDHATTTSAVYNAFLTGVFVIYTTTLLIIYILIGRKLYMRRRKTEDVFHAHLHTDHLSSKMTKIALTISVIFALSYIPLFVVKLAAVAINEEELNAVEFVLLKIVERSYAINHVANPFIYAIFDKQFREQFSSLVNPPCRSVEVKESMSGNSTTMASVT